jgi:L-fucose mutarotase
VLSPELLMHLCAMGHGEWVALVDANFTADQLAAGKPVVRLPGLSLERVAQAVLSVFPLAEDVSAPVAYMHVCRSTAAHRSPAQQAVVNLAASLGASALPPEALERFVFYDRTRLASLIVQTGEATAYGNVLFCKGVIFSP